MAVTVDATNLVLVDAADALTGWTSSIGGLQTTTLGTREGGTSLEDQASQENFQIYHTIASTDLSNATIFGWQRSGGPATEGDVTGAGFAMYLGDGTNNRVYAVGGQDNYAFFYLGWGSFRLNGAGLPTTFRQDGGGAPTTTAVTRVGYGGRFPAKAAGNSNNIAVDVLRYCLNTNPALLIEGGTTGARGQFGEIVTLDESTSNAWGIIRQLVTGSKSYEVTFGMQIGSLDASAFFEDSDFQLFLNGSLTSGGTITAGSMDFDFVGFTGGTNVINFDNFFIQSIGTVSNWTASDTNIDTLQWTNGQFVDMGTFTFQAQDIGNKFLADVNFVNCGQVDLVGLDVDRIGFVGTTNANGALVINTNSVPANWSDLSFTSDGTGHGILIANSGTYTFDNWTFSGYGAAATTDAAIHVTATDGNTVINIINGGDTPTIRNTGTGTVTVNNTVTITVEVVDPDGNPIENARVLLEAAAGGDLTAGDDILTGLTNASGIIETTAFNFTNPQPVTGRVRRSTTSPYYKTGNITGTITSAGFSVTVQMILDE